MHSQLCKNILHAGKKLRTSNDQRVACVGRHSHVAGDEAEWVTAVHAHELLVSRTAGHVSKVVSESDADDRMSNLAVLSPFLQKAVAAAAGVLDASVARRDFGRAMTEHTTQVANFLAESGKGAIWIAAVTEDQRVAALHAHVFAAAIPIRERNVAVLAEKARQGMPHTGQRPVPIEVLRPAPTAPRGQLRREVVIVDLMSPESTSESHTGECAYRLDCGSPV